MSNIIMTKNKYDKIIVLPPIHDTSMEQMIENILLKLGVSYEKQFYFDETGFRKIKYDFALTNDLSLVCIYNQEGNLSHERCTHRNSAVRFEDIA